jgi:hypothetical protein
VTGLPLRYLLLLLVGIALIAGGELVPRPVRGFKAGDLQRTLNVVEEEIDHVETKIAVGGFKPADGETEIRLFARRRDLEREGLVRDVQTSIVVVLFLASIAFAVVTLPKAVWIRRTGHMPFGNVEVMSDEMLAVEAGSAAAMMAKLSPTRDIAVAALLAAPPLRCRYCGRPSRWAVVGRVGRRIFRKKRPEGAVELELDLGEGWWHRASPPEPCKKCGSVETEAAI